MFAVRDNATNPEASNYTNKLRNNIRKRATYVKMFFFSPQVFSSFNSYLMQLNYFHTTLLFVKHFKPQDLVQLMSVPTCA